MIDMLFTREWSCVYAQGEIDNMLCQPVCKNEDWATRKIMLALPVWGSTSYKEEAHHIVLYAVINRKEVHDASGEYKEVPDAVHPFYFFHCIKNAADGIEYTA